MQRYRSKISGPLLDRIDIHVEVPPVEYKDLASQGGGETSAGMLERVKKAREIQVKRLRRTRIHANARMNSRQIRQFCELDSESMDLLEKAMNKFGLSARAHSRILKIARTIADLAESERIQANHVAEAIQYRTLDRRVIR
ncbi:MAG: ATP-binding protein [Thermodesulfobacteriota bacterium]